MMNNTIEQYIRLGTINCGGFSQEHAKRRAILDKAKNEKIDILLLQETNLKGQDEEKVKNEWGVGTCIFSSATSLRGSGVAIFCGDHNITLKNPLYDAEGKFLAADAEVRGEKFRIINGHFPSCTRESIFESTIESAHSLIQGNMTYMNDHVIFGGDFNFVELGEHRIPPGQNHRDTLADRHWNEFCEIYDLTDPCKFDRPVQFTREQSGIFSKIDRFYTTPGINFKKSAVHNLALSDHHLVVLEFSIRGPRKRGQGRYKSNTQVYDRPDFLREIEDFTESHKRQESYHLDPPKWWKKYKNEVTKIHKKHAKLRMMEIRRDQKEKELAVELAQTNLVNNPTSQILNQRYQEAKLGLRTFILDKTKEKMVKQRYNNFGKNYFTTKEFFRKYKQGQKDSFIAALENEQGETKTDPKEILRTAKIFYDNLYKRERLDPEKQAQFLSLVQRKLGIEENLDLNRDLEDAETEKAIKGTKKGGSPGLDGTKIDFYEKFIRILKVPITHVLQHYFSTSQIPYDAKLSAISIIFKKGDRKKIRNYRPISLSNCDLKILTKIMCERLKKYMDLLIGKTQYACPGKTIASANHILRDVFQESVKKRQENFIISIDFIKAFDSVDRAFLIKILEKMGFEGRFLETVKNLNQATGAKLIINGFISKTIKLRRGIKQGDALSLFLFLVALEPLILAINLNQNIKGIKTPTGSEMKTLCYADDANLTLSTQDSLNQSLQIIKDFGDASGLRVHGPGHAKSCTCLITHANATLQITNLPPDFKYIQDGIEILGTAIGTESFVNQFSDKIHRNYEENAVRLYSKSQSFNERVVISNSLLLPLLTFHFQFHGIPDPLKAKIDKTSKEFAINKHTTVEKYYEATRTRDHGGYGFPHITKFTETMILKQIFRYVEARINNTPLDFEMGYVHSNIGIFISRICGFRPINIRNTYPPNYYYQKIKNFINFYQITKEELENGQIKVVRDRIRNGTTLPPNSSRRPLNLIFQGSRFRTPNEITNTLLTHKTQTFLYRKQERLLNLPSIRELWGPGGTANCQFCDRRRETELHLFFECPQVQNIWRILGISTGSPFTEREVMNMTFGPDTRNRGARIYLTAETTRKIWQNRNEIKYGDKTRLGLANFMLELHNSIQWGLDFENRRPRQPYQTQLTNVVGGLHHHLDQLGILPHVD